MRSAEREGLNAGVVGEHAQAGEGRMQLAAPSVVSVSVFLLDSPLHDTLGCWAGFGFNGTLAFS